MKRYPYMFFKTVDSVPFVVINNEPKPDQNKLGDNYEWELDNWRSKHRALIISMEEGKKIINHLYDVELFRMAYILRGVEVTCIAIDDVLPVLYTQEDENWDNISKEILAECTSLGQEELLKKLKSKYKLVIKSSWKSQSTQ